MAQVSVIRHQGIGRALGGHILSETVAFECDHEVAGVQLTVGRGEVWLSRDEACELATALRAAAIDG